jgi:hypothetical protein
LGGWAFMLGGLAWTLGWFASSRPEYSRFNSSSLPIDRYANAVDSPLVIMGMLLLSAGLTGLFVRYGQASGGLGRFSLGFGALGGLAGAAGGVGLAMYDREHWWFVFFLGTILQFLGLVLFGLAGLRQQVLPRWNGLPVFAGAWVPLSVLAGIIIEQTSGRWVEWPQGVYLVLWLFTLSGLVSLGYLLQSGSQPITGCKVTGSRERQET